ncbi:hypothetical protein PN462_09600 [Spirulina sp. CS-785/01]|uniref:hypothetical protein n=1 Tax=Spirulina sp. CS-785/01 TaxID=3021716 RepID=UPI00233076A1|nr:hypothetical protein [Spirulina sp. CS-785/01]MDB9313352.1 hypothetical protein [Spirulina sp. CS-785/01]
MLEETTIAGLASAAAAIPGSVTVATVTAPAPGILGVIGFTTTTAVTLPIAGVVAASAAVGYGVYTGVKWAKSRD